MGDWDCELGLGIWMEVGWGIGIRDWDYDWGLGLRFGIWIGNWASGLGIGIRDSDWNWD